MYLYIRSESFCYPMCWQVNGREVGQDPRVLQEELQAACGSVVLKILPSYHEAIPPRQVTDPNTAQRKDTGGLYTSRVLLGAVNYEMSRNYI